MRQKAPAGFENMNRCLKVGDRVRVTELNRVEGYQPGDRGTILWGPNTSASGILVFYLVAMDKDAPGSGTTFTAEEIEADE